MKALKEYRRQLSMIKTVHSSSTDLDGGSPPSQKKKSVLNSLEKLENDDINTAFKAAERIAYEMFVGHTLKPRKFDFKQVIEHPELINEMSQQERDQFLSL